MKTIHFAVSALAGLLAAAPPTDAGTGRESQPAPADLASVQNGSDTMTLWPWVAQGFETPTDPVNLIFLGDADPRQIRQALMSVDGHRGAFGFPPGAPFDCRWSDAIGAPETAWGEPDGWTGSAVGLECGDYSTLRVHLRLFRQGTFTIGGAHFEVLIPGTTTHEVLSWEFAEAFVRLDLQRAGALLIAPELTDAINAAPSWRAIRPEVFNSVPSGLRQLLGLPGEAQVAPVPIPSDGRASVLRVVQTFVPERSDVRQVFDQPFGQFVPRPFCSSGPGDLIRVDGHLRFDYRVKTTPSGRYAARFSATGTLQVTPVDPATLRPIGPTVPAVVSETHRYSLTDRREQVRLVRQQSILTDPAQLLSETLDAGRRDHHELDLECGVEP